MCVPMAIIGHALRVLNDAVFMVKKCEECERLDTFHPFPAASCPRKGGVKEISCDGGTQNFTKKLHMWYTNHYNSVEKKPTLNELG